MAWGPSQAAFGRSRRVRKSLRFAVASVEASTLATNLFDLPPMGRLSYLQALLPAVEYSGRLQALPLDVDETASTARMATLTANGW
jgi:hypothetical protein